MSSLKQWRYLQSIVEHGSFSAASQQLYIAQSALSRQIKLLEQELGFLIFDRSSKKLQLTAAGEMLYKKIQQQFKQLHTTIEQVQAFANGQGRCLNIAHSSSIVLDAAKLAALRTFCQQQQCQIEITQLSSEQQIEALLKAEIDLGILRPPLKHSLHDLQQLRYACSDLYVAVHQQDEFFAAKDQIHVRDLRLQPFVSLPHSQRGGLSDLVAKLCLSHGFQPRPAIIRSRKISQLDLVAQGLGICIVPEEFRSILPQHVRLIALADSNCQSEVHLCWANQQDQLLAACIAMLQTLNRAEKDQQIE